MTNKEKLKKEYYKYDYNSKKSALKTRFLGNVIINDYNGKKELIVYNKDFIVPDGVPINNNIDRTRKFFYNENNCLQAKNTTNTDKLLENLQSSLMNSRKRSLDNLFGYCLSNKFDYFITLTFDSSINRFDLDCVNYSWKKFKQKMQYYFPDITIVLIPEGHPTSGAIHFHGLIGNANLDKYLVEAKNNNKKSEHYGELLKSKFGYQIYNFIDTFYTAGFSTVVKIDPETPQKKVVNYLVKYISKEITDTEKNKATNVRYNKKSYYCTRNLIAKTKQVCYLEKEQLQEFISKAELTKQTTRFVVYEL